MASDESTDRGFAPVEEAPGALRGNGSAGAVGVVEDAPSSVPAGAPTRGDDLALHVPALQVDEVALELDASIGIHHLKLEAKGLAGELYLNANLEHVVALVQGSARRLPPSVTPAAQDTGGDGVRGELKAAVGSARSAYSAVRHAHEEAGGEPLTQGGDGSRDDHRGSRPSGGVALAAGLTGVAAGAMAAGKGRALGEQVLERLPGRSPSTPRRVVQQVLDHLPSTPPSTPGRVAQQARRAPKQVGRLVRVLT